MIEKVWEYVQKFGLLKEQDRIIAGVSGGADSVCLFFLLEELKKRLDFTFCVVHVEHGIRGQDSIEDALFVKRLCETYNVEYYQETYPVPELAKSLGMSLEEAGRKVRYEAFRKVKEYWGGTKIATAHHMNDQAETILMNLFRGTGLRGMKGIEPVSDDLIRPMLCVTRGEIEAWLLEQGYSYREDATNAMDLYTRNRVRNRILPEAAAINTRAVEHLAAFASVAGECEDYLQQVAKTVLEKISVRIDKEVLLKKELLQEAELIQKYVLRLALQDVRDNGGGLKDLAAVHVDSLRHLFFQDTGRKIDLPGGWYGRKSYDGVIVGWKPFGKKEQRTENCHLIEIPGTVLLRDGKTCSVEILEYKKGCEIPQKAYTKWFDYDKIKGSLELRTRHTGDFLVVNRDGGKKKLKDYFIDEKIDRTYRDDVLLLAEGNHVLWVVGCRISEYYRVTDETKRVLAVAIEEASGIHD